MRYQQCLFLLLALSVFTGELFPAPGAPSSAYPSKEALARDRKLQEEARWRSAQKQGRNVSRASDARGACDGVINGEWGFHTEREPNPWWRIDLGAAFELDRIVLYNRTDFAERASRIIVLLARANDAPLEKVYQHTGAPFFGFSDKRPLSINVKGHTARVIRLQLPGTHYFHLDEVQIYKSGSNRNIAPEKDVTQSSTSQWSKAHATGDGHDANEQIARITNAIKRGMQLAEALKVPATPLKEAQARLGELASEQHAEIKAQLDALHETVNLMVRGIAFSNPLLDFDDILFVKRAPGTLPHMSDQYYGWWSRPGGGVYLLKKFKTPQAQLACLTDDFPEGSFLRPCISYDARRVLFAYCRHYAHVSEMEKVDKDKLPADAFYHLYEMDIDGANVQQLTFGRYDDFDGRYLPGGGIVFLSTRKGQFIQCSEENTKKTLHGTCPDSYVRCGGDNRRPCAVYTLHALSPDRSVMRPISAFENFEWTPSVAHDGRILYARWDYIDRFNGPFMSLWSTNPTGTNPQLVYGNFTTIPQCVFEARSIPGSHKLVVTGSAHHSITGGSLALLDPDRGNEFHRPITRLTPEVCFPETEGRPETYYANPFPLSEQLFLVSWSSRPLPPHRGSAQVRGKENPVNALGIYLYDAFGNLELIHRDPAISSMNPLPVRPRPEPPVYPEPLVQEQKKESFFYLQDVYQGLPGIERGTITGLRVVAVPPKTQPHMNSPHLGVSREDPGKYLLGTAPVASDGSAFFRAPAGVPVFFQAVREDGVAVQTMRTLTYGQEGQTLSCIGCHEPRETAPAVSQLSHAASKPPAKLIPGPGGSWPLRFDTLVQPVLDRACVRCHKPGSGEPKAEAFDLTGRHSYHNLISFDNDNLKNLAFERDVSVAGTCTAQQSSLLRIVKGARGHDTLDLSDGDFLRIVLWMDLYAHKQGSFSSGQEERLAAFKKKMRTLAK